MTALRTLVACATGACMSFVHAAAVDAQQSTVIPDAPAFTFLGATPSTISRPTSARDFAFGLADGVDSLGRVQRGLAFDVTPWVLLPGRMTNKRYRTHRGSFILGNFQASLGTVQAVGDSTSTDVAFGLRTNIFNGTDPLGDSALGVSMDAAVDRCIVDAKKEDGSIDAVKLESCSDTAVATLTKAWMDAGHWNDFGLSVAAAFGAKLRESRFDSFEGRGGAAWVTMALPIGDSFGQLVTQARADWTRGGVQGDTSSIAAGSKLVFGGPRVNGFAEVTQSWSRKRTDKSTGRWSVGVEFRASENVWLSTGFGSTYDNTTTGGRTLLIANLRWNLSDKARFSPR